MFWVDLEYAIQTPNETIIMSDGDCLLEVEKLCDGYAECSIYNKKLFGTATALSIDYIERNAVEVKLEDSDRQEIINIYNAIYSRNAYQVGDLSLEISNDLKIRINNLFCRDFYQKYNLKKKEK